MIAVGLMCITTVTALAVSIDPVDTLGEWVGIVTQYLFTEHMDEFCAGVVTVAEHYPNAIPRIANVSAQFFAHKHVAGMLEEKGIIFRREEIQAIVEHQLKMHVTGCKDFLQKLEMEKLAQCKPIVTTSCVDGTCTRIEIPCQQEAEGEEKIEDD
jgi:hypothetical protein